MSLSASEAEPNTSRASALEHLKRTRQSITTNTRQTNGVASGPFAGGASAPPVQSRDATVGSQYWPRANPSTGSGTILVPNSSPIQQHMSSLSPQQRPQLQGLAWQNSRTMRNDPLLTSSSLTSASSTVSKSSRLRPPDAESDSDRPRKRFNRGSSGEITPASEAATPVPSSPAPLPPKKSKRKKIADSDEDDEGDDDDYDPTAQDDTLPKQALTRLNRGRRPTPTTSHTPPADRATVIKRLKVTHPGLDDEVLAAIYDGHGGDVPRILQALADMSTPIASPPKTIPSSASTPSFRHYQHPPAPGPFQAGPYPTQFYQPSPAIHYQGTLNFPYASTINTMNGVHPNLAATHFYPTLAHSHSYPTMAISTPPHPAFASQLQSYAAMGVAYPSHRAPPPTPTPTYQFVSDTSRVSRGKQSMIYHKRSNMAADSGERQQTRRKPSRAASEEAEYDDDSDDNSMDGGTTEKTRLEEMQEEAALKWFNGVEEASLIELAACTATQARTVIGLRPFASIEDLQRKLSRAKGVSGKMYEDYRNLVHGYGDVDSVLNACEVIGSELSAIINYWAKSSANDSSSADVPKALEDGDQTKGTTTPTEDAGIHLVTLAQPTISDSDSVERRAAMKDYIQEQPSTLAPLVQLKDYQLLGLNWLNLLHSRAHSCILADEMGLGKTVQVISFFAHLKSKGNAGPHLIIVPSSTLENWTREFEKFAPSLKVQTYYASQKERVELRHQLLEARDDWEVLITTYNLAQGAEPDRKFLRKVNWETCIFDEGHVLKNYMSQRYTNLMQITARWRLLLTGTPLQNNLQELVSLMNFILPELFKEVSDSLRAIFKVKSSSAASLLSHERVSRAKKMMTPFVLRRRKDQVLKDLPRKEERIEWCEMTPLQKSIYREALQRSRKTILEQVEEQATDALPDDDEEPELVKGRGRGKGKAKPKPKPKKAAPKPIDTSSNVLMDLRKAASHPMLFRRLYDDKKVGIIAKLCLKEPEFLDSKLGLVIEDMSVMTDAELHVFCKRYKSCRKHALHNLVHQEAGKITVLLRLLKDYKQQGRRVLIFSQFTQILDILKALLDELSIKYLVLTGSTAVDERQSLVDEFTDDDSIQVFLLSTKAGGMGINLTAASAVIIFDQDFNPHNDLQAADRAYRIGQKRDVDVVRLITRGTIEEDMLNLGKTKLALDEAVAGDAEDGGAGGETAPEKAMKASLMSVLRKQLEQEEGQAPGEPAESIGKPPVNGTEMINQGHKPISGSMDTEPTTGKTGPNETATNMDTTTQLDSATTTTTL